MSRFICIFQNRNVLALFAWGKFSRLMRPSGSGARSRCGAGKPVFAASAYS
ncbi:hypothetical protein DWUX_2046 [Desulfovibrio diazotrophicus]|nr:hypothetical protein DWUX_2046 [Desulfovibrio diazotrophicus]